MEKWWDLRTKWATCSNVTPSQFPHNDRHALRPQETHTEQRSGWSLQFWLWKPALAQWNGSYCVAGYAKYSKLVYFCFKKKQKKSPKNKTFICIIHTSNYKKQVTMYLMLFMPSFSRNHGCDIADDLDSMTLPSNQVAKTKSSFLLNLRYFS